MADQEDIERGERLAWAREFGSKRVKNATLGAKMLRVPYGTYSCHENGSRGFDRRAGRKYAGFWGVRLDWLMDGLGKPDMTPLEEALALLPEPRDQEMLLTYARGIAASRSRQD
jgi:hypothetical protein